MMRPRRLAKFGRMEMTEAATSVARYEYRATRCRKWTERVTALRAFFPLMLKTILAPYWARGAQEERRHAVLLREVHADLVADAAETYRYEESNALRRVAELRRELMLARMEARHCRERRENMDEAHAAVVRARLVASLVDAENDDDDRLEWTTIDERRGAVA